MSDEVVLILTLIPIAFAGSLIYGFTGFGAGLVTIPLATHFMPLSVAIAVFALVDFASALRLGLQRPRDASMPEIRRLLPFVLIGTVTGVTVLVNLPRQGAMFALGAFVAAYAVYALYPKKSATIISQHFAYLAGFCGGITSTLFGAGGPPYAIYLSHRPLGKDQFRATITLTTIFSIGMRVTAFFLTGLLMKTEVWVTALFAALSAMVGLTLASMAFRHISRELLLKLVAVLLLVNGLSLMMRALS